MSDTEVRVALVDAFTTTPLEGNAAGVVPDASGLSDGQMQAIARELSVSETAFCTPSGPADRQIRYFTPTQEVDLCGHATIGTHAYLAETGEIDAGTHSFETNVGVLEAQLEDNGSVWMSQDQPTVREVEPDIDQLCDVLNIDPAGVRPMVKELPIAVSSTGLPFLLIPATYLSTVGNADPNMDAVEALSDEFDVTGLYLFTFDALDAEATLHARMFAPGAGVPEDPVTGTASGAAGAYLRRFNAFDGDLPQPMRFEQGHFIDRPGTVFVDVAETIRVGGNGVVSLTGELGVPAGDTGDDILEA